MQNTIEVWILILNFIHSPQPLHNGSIRLFFINILLSSWYMKVPFSSWTPCHDTFPSPLPCRKFRHCSVAMLFRLALTFPKAQAIFFHLVCIIIYIISMYKLCPQRKALRSSWCHQQQCCFHRRSQTYLCVNQIWNPPFWSTGRGDVNCFQPRS